MSSPLRQWLERLGLAQYGDRFDADDIDLDVVPTLSEQDLEKLGVSMGHRKRLLKAIAELNGAPPSPVAADTMAAAPMPPKHLVGKILQSKSALEGERKQVTVLFADVKGSMDLAEQLDPEEWSRIMQRFFTILAAGAERFERIRMLELCQRQEASLAAEVEAVEAELYGRARGIDAITRLKTITGVGDLVATTIYAWVGEIGRFPDAKSLAAYAGLVPSVRQSAASQQTGQITKQGANESGSRRFVRLVGGGVVR